MTERSNSSPSAPPSLEQEDFTTRMMEDDEPITWTQKSERESITRAHMNFFFLVEASFNRHSSIFTTYEWWWSKESCCWSFFYVMLEGDQELLWCGSGHRGWTEHDSHVTPVGSLDGDQPPARFVGQLDHGLCFVGA